MKVYQTHSWRLDYRGAVALQRGLQKKIRRKALALGRIRRVAGADVAISARLDRLVACVAVFEFPSLELIETRTAHMRTTFPYIPGLLSFREIPCLARCFEAIRASVDAVICDGQGIAHPRGAGLASHLGLLLRKPTVGCAKSLLVGEHDPVALHAGSFAPLRFGGRRVGSVVRTRDGVRPVYVSPGHLSDQAGARRLVLACTRGFRLPEPTRHADRIAGEEKRKLEIGATG